MWQQNVSLDSRLHSIDYCEPLPQRLFLWECAAGLVQSPASTNSESSSTSTPDQCPTSPALTFCEMRNGNSMRPTSMWSSVKSSSPDRENTIWNPILNQPSASYNSVSPKLPSSDYFTYPVENLKQEQQQEEYFLGGRNGRVIDESVIALQASRNSSGSGASKIGNFMNLLRQSDRPIHDCTTAAASCSHLSQLLTSQEAPEMWIAHSSRLPAMLSEVLPGKSSEPEHRHKRKLLEDVDSVSTVTKEEEEALSSEKATNDSELFSKRTKFENSNTFPFKMQVRKEKLGERISALQQLVSPFGKTDTASVLLEAIGYIKFLHEQVQVLSSPYMKSPGTSSGRHINEAGKETKQDLRSRGLCLVPISCTLQVANDNGADYWTPSLHSGLK